MHVGNFYGFEFGAGAGSVGQSLHPLHPLYAHFVVQSAAFCPHQDLHRPVGAAAGSGVGAAVGMAVCAEAGVGAGAGSVGQSLHPLHPLYVHFVVQSAAFCPHQDLHRPVGAATGDAVGAVV